MDNILVALYEVKRQNFLIAFKQNPELFDPALAYAYDNRIAPFFHQEVMREVYNGQDPFDSVYAVDADFMKNVLTYVDEKWLAKDYKALSFSDLENKFGGYKTNRMELVHTLEYACLCGRFDDTVWDAISHMAPCEAKISDSFEAKDVCVE